MVRLMRRHGGTDFYNICSQHILTLEMLVTSAKYEQSQRSPPPPHPNVKHRLAQQLKKCQLYAQISTIHGNPDLFTREQIILGSCFIYPNMVYLGTFFLNTKIN